MLYQIINTKGKVVREFKTDSLNENEVLRNYQNGYTIKEIK